MTTLFRETHALSSQQYYAYIQLSTPYIAYTTIYDSVHLQHFISSISTAYDLLMPIVSVLLHACIFYSSHPVTSTATSCSDTRVHVIPIALRFPFNLSTRRGQVNEDEVSRYVKKETE
jgi:hypothetical protein